MTTTIRTPEGVALPEVWFRACQQGHPRVLYLHSAGGRWGACPVCTAWAGLPEAPAPPPPVQLQQPQQPRSAVLLVDLVWAMLAEGYLPPGALEPAGAALVLDRLRACLVEQVPDEEGDLGPDPTLHNMLTELPIGDLLAEYGLLDGHGAVAP